MRTLGFRILAGCIIAATALPAAAQQALVERDLRRAALSLISLIRVAEGCRIRVAEPARRRASELEAALAALGPLPPARGVRVELPAAMIATRDGAAQAGRAWCSVQRADVEEAEEMLASAEGEKLLRRLRALRDTPG
jgi:hypothetical protein